jgi:hypothetical protein
VYDGNTTTMSCFCATAPCGPPSGSSTCTPVGYCATPGYSCAFGASVCFGCLPY